MCMQQAFWTLANRMLLCNMGASINVSLDTTEKRETMVSIIQRDINFLSFPDPTERLAAIQDIFSPDITWFGFDGSTHHGHKPVLERSELLVGQLKGYSHRPAGLPSVCQNMVTCKWEVVPEGTEEDFSQRPVIEGGDVLIVEEGKAKLLWTYVDRFDEMLLPNLGKGN